MERLTSYESECKREMICRYEDCDTCEEYCPHLNEDNCPCLQDVLEKLSEYEDLEEQGKLLKLPCKVGDRVWTFEEYSRGELTGEVVDFKVEKIEIAFDSEGKPYFLIDNMDFPLDCLGKTLFHSESEAESALQKMNEMEGKE